jgi:DNA-binding LacI/PurR family transcriptional regulator
MAEVSFLTIAEQVAMHLRNELKRGRWAGQMPGKHELAAELAVNNKTVETALRQLENEGLLLPQGAGRRRAIPHLEGPRRRVLRIAFLAGETSDFGLDYMVELRHRLRKAGHAVQIAPKVVLDMHDDPDRVARMVRSVKADAWVVLGGSRKVLEWFAAQPEPSFAIFGRRGGLPIAATGPEKAAATIAATRELIRLGHRRIVFMVRPRRRLPQPGEPERAFLKALAEQGLEVGEYNLPAWDETPDDFQRCLDRLFLVTPPTAMIVDEAPLFFAAHQFLSRRGLRVPDDVSLVATDPNPAFRWCRPSIAHITWSSVPLVRRVTQWAANVSRGRKDLRQTLTPARFVPGGTIGPVREDKPGKTAVRPGSAVPPISGLPNQNHGPSVRPPTAKSPLV